ncbi:MAG: lysoplasmalogenase family protein, partial [Anaerolineales bacterium]|nr:lysoplasmalogenase family protein [Anaerolineales bacterium]
LPAVIFGVVIFLMVSAGTLTLFRPEWPQNAASATAVGVVLVFVSDALLSYNRFVRPFSWARLKVRLPYQLGQIAITAGAILFLRGFR